MNGAASNGYYEIVKFLVEFRTEGCTRVALESASARGYVRILQLLTEHYGHTFPTTPQKCIDLASSNGHIEVVRYLFSSSGGIISLDRANELATKHNEYDVVNYITKVTSSPKKKGNAMSLSSSSVPIVTSTAATTPVPLLSQSQPALTFKN
eukprot:gene7246-8423_t